MRERLAISPTPVQNLNLLTSSHPAAQYQSFISAAETVDGAGSLVNLKYSAVNLTWQPAALGSPLTSRHTTGGAYPTQAVVLVDTQPWEKTQSSVTLYTQQQQQPVFPTSDLQPIAHRSAAGARKRKRAGSASDAGKLVVSAHGTTSDLTTGATGKVSSSTGNDNV